MKRIVIPFAVTFLVLAGCSSDRFVWGSFQHVPVSGWEVQNVLHFTSDTIHRSGTYGIRLVVRVSHAYLFQELWLRAEGKLGKVDTIQNAILPIMLTDKEHPMMGLNLKQTERRLGSVWLDSGEVYKVGISHVMRSNTVTGVSDIGVVLVDEN